MVMVSDKPLLLISSQPAFLLLVNLEYQHIRDGCTHHTSDEGSSDSQQLALEYILFILKGATRLLFNFLKQSRRVVYGYDRAPGQR